MTFDFLYYITLLLFYFSSVYKILFYVFLCQKKDYKRKRVFTHLTDTNEGRKLYLNPFFFTEIILVFWYLIGIFPGFFHYAVFLLFLLYFLYIIKNIFQRSFYYPIVTLKTIAIGIFSTLFLVLISLLPLVDRFFWILFLHATIFITVSFFVVIFSQSTDFVKDVVINRAIKKLSLQKGMSVIAVTGSFGKSSTKDLINSALKEKFNTLINSDSLNTPYGVAKTIESSLSRRKQIFIAEINLKEKNDVNDFLQIISPKIFIFAGIDDKAASLARNISEIISWYHALAQNITYNNLLLINEDNIFLSKLFRRSRNLKHKKIFYGLSSQADIRASDIKVGKYETQFTVYEYGKKIGRFVVKILGKHSVTNILPAIFIAEKYGVKRFQLKNFINKIRPFPHKMEPFLTANKTILIDDTQGASPTSILKAIEFMKVFKKRRILVFEPIIELGKRNKEIHRQIGQLAAEVFDEIYLTNTNFKKEIEQGFKKATGKTLLRFYSPLEIATRLGGLARDDAVLFEGEEAKNVFLLLNSDPVY